MVRRILLCARAWARYISTCRPLAFAALLLIVLVTVATAARCVFNAGAAHALASCRVYAESPVRIVYAGQVYNK